LRKFDPDRLVLETINEPVFKGHERDWHEFQPSLIASMRDGAPEHTIIASGTDWSNIGDLVKMEPLKDENIIYTFHWYDPHIFTHQGATWSEPYYPVLRGLPYPSSPGKIQPLADEQESPQAKEALLQYGAERWDGRKLSDQLQRAAFWSSQNRAPIYCGEFGCYTLVTPAEDRLRWFKDITSGLREHGIGWAVWGYDEVFGLNRRKGPSGVSYDEAVTNVLFGTETIL